MLPADERRRERRTARGEPVAELDTGVGPPEDCRDEARAERHRVAEAAARAEDLPRGDRDRHERELLLRQYEQPEADGGEPELAAPVGEQAAKQQCCGERLRQEVHARVHESWVERDEQPFPARAAARATKRR